MVAGVAPAPADEVAASGSRRVDGDARAARSADDSGGPLCMALTWPWRLWAWSPKTNARTAAAAATSPAPADTHGRRRRLAPMGTTSASGRAPAAAAVLA